ncbi:laminin G [Streptomyces sp. HNM0575]|uniref:exo-alpha-sialidase n=1 Tax=Streptomyces sp. HNM0575 TaxID=2716338 RepID=UPI00145FC0E7|nr:exo-alpha-sialidase [Streptomyces sp. HNM0575]NLU72875.1 laminin G [Streptomyces sp. HNM0575]
MSSGCSASRTRSSLRAALLTALCASLLAVPDPAARAHTRQGPQGGAPGLTQEVLFKASRDEGYSCFRIPAVVRTVKGDLLAFAEGRVHDCGDAGDIDIVVKRSSDGGRTWGPLRVASDGGGDTHGNPAPVVDRRTGRILLAQTFNPGRTDGKNCDSPCDRTPHLQYSDDDGESWSKPEDLSAQLRSGEWNSWYATGPGHGIQLRHGLHAGRIVLGVNGETWRDGRNTENHAALAVSDDGGRSWRRGATDSRPHSPDGVFRQKPQELTLHERRDGTVLAGARETEGTDLGHRTAAVAAAGGDLFTAPFSSLPDLYAPQVQGSVLPFGDRLLLSAPADPDRRRTMTIRSSYDDGRTWEGVDRGRTVTTDWSGYSDMVRASALSVGLIYEGGAADARDEIRFALFTEDWLGARRGADPTTEDRAPGAGDAAVLGGAQPVAGHDGGALAFDGRDDAVRLPFRPQLPLNERDFTASLWFRCTDGQPETGEQPLLWMGGVGASQPQVRIVADAANGRVTGAVTARQVPAPSATAQVSTQGAYDDGRWHHAELRRGDGQLRLSVDRESVSAQDVPGSVSVGSPFGVHLGQRLDSRAHFTGALDDVRVSAGDGSLLDLPLDGVRAPAKR